MVRFLHTADWQLGKAFHRVEGDSGADLRQARLRVVDTLATLAREESVDFVVVAGDVFDANDLEDRVILQALERLRAFPCPVYLLPGNHDHGAPAESIYQRPAFVRHVPDSVRVLMERAPLLVPDASAPRAVLLPAPLLQRHEPGDPTAHLTTSFGADVGAGLPRVGLAHGTVIDFDDGEAPNLIDPKRAESAGLDYLALGDCHSVKKVTPRCWYSGAPEATAFREPRPGHALIVEIDSPGAEPSVREVKVGRTSWIEHSAHLGRAEDVAALRGWFDALPAPLETLVRLEVDGALPLGELDHFDDLLTELHGRLVHLEVREDIVADPTDEDIASLPRDGYLEAAVERLRDAMQAPEDEGRDARDALRLLYRLAQQERNASC